MRFGIETFHKILKSGRRSEDKRLGSLERLERCLAVDMITAWRLLYLTMLGRQTPKVESELFFNGSSPLAISRNTNNHCYLDSV